MRVSLSFPLPSPPPLPSLPEILQFLTQLVGPIPQVGSYLGGTPCEYERNSKLIPKPFRKIQKTLLQRLLNQKNFVCIKNFDSYRFFLLSVNDTWHKITIGCRTWTYPSVQLFV